MMMMMMMMMMISDDQAEGKVGEAAKANGWKSRGFFCSEQFTGSTYHDHDDYHDHGNHNHYHNHYHDDDESGFTGDVSVVGGSRAT